MSDGLWSSLWSPAKHMLTLEQGGSKRLEAEGKTGLHCEIELLGRMGTESFPWVAVWASTKPQRSCPASVTLGRSTH